MTVQPKCFVRKRLPLFANWWPYKKVTVCKYEWNGGGDIPNKWSIKSHYFKKKEQRKISATPGKLMSEKTEFRLFNHALHISEVDLLLLSSLSLKDFRQCFRSVIIFLVSGLEGWDGECLCRQRKSCPGFHAEYLNPVLILRNILKLQWLLHIIKKVYQWFRWYSTFISSRI